MVAGSSAGGGYALGATVGDDRDGAGCVMSSSFLGNRQIDLLGADGDRRFVVESVIRIETLAAGDPRT
jgi:hypothetical protein